MAVSNTINDLLSTNYTDSNSIKLAVFGYYIRGLISSFLCNVLRMNPSTIPIYQVLLFIRLSTNSIYRLLLNEIINNVSTQALVKYLKP